ncbi:unnamed protein product [marine sediment metagenome]|uniref:Polymerase nucleotidyl transferase domain-containing protein n=1 Tax=marine sediment metagenome TaxID=412755 RepID=X1T9U1_9ZZZZ
MKLSSPLLEEPKEYHSSEEKSPTPGQLKYIAVLSQQLHMPEPSVRTYGEAGRMIRELEAEREHRKRLKSGNPNTVRGTCYEDAWRFLIKQGEGELVHGTVESLGKRVGHAWVETDAGYIWEPQTQGYFTIKGFDVAANPIEEHRYTVEEASIMLTRVGKHGPWTDEERARWLSEGKYPILRGTEKFKQFVRDTVDDFALNKEEYKNRVESLVPEVKIQNIELTGSYAKGGKPTETSDVDLLVEYSGVLSEDTVRERLLGQIGGFGGSLFDVVVNKVETKYW